MPLWPNNSQTMPQVSSPYGPRTGGYSNFHEGVDFRGYTNIVAVLAGLVTWAGPYNAAAGNAVCYKPDAFGNRVEIKHFHPKGWSVSKGARVNPGQKVATMGQTGNATGDCDHFEIRVDGNRVDPIAWMNALGSTAGGGTMWSESDKQTFLVSIGLDTGGIGNGWGPKSAAATSTFQDWAGLTVDGDFGPDTTKRAQVVSGGGNRTTRAASAIQTFLAGRGLYTGTIDNDWGNRTSMGTYRFQRAEGLTADALWGDLTDARAFAVVVTPAPPAATGKNITQRPTSEIQTMLKAKGLYTGDIDAQYGPATAAAVVTLQTQGTLEADGIWGAKTDVYGFKRPAFLTSCVQGVTITGGTKVAGRVIRGVNVHHFGSTGDDRTYFAGPNARSSVPTVAILTDGTAWEYVPPGTQPWSTGAADKDRISIELQNASGDSEWRVTDAQAETLIRILVELAQADQLDGVPVDFTPTRQTVQGDKETGIRPTACPGPYVMARLDGWVAEAQRRIADLEPDPEPEPDGVTLTRAQADRLAAILAEAGAIIGAGA